MWSLLLISVLAGFILGVSTHLTYLMLRAAKLEGQPA